MDIKDLNRRELLQVGITSGFALAVSPIAAWAITTPTNGIVAEATTIPTGGAKMPAYWAMPKGKGPFPTVLVIQEIFGIHEYIQDICRRLAHEGYLAVAPALYFRQGDPTKMEAIERIVTDIVSKVPQQQVWGDLDETLKWLKTTKKSNPARVGITGFCWGGNVVWTYAYHNPALKAGVAWYGRLVGSPPTPDTQYPVDIAKDIKVPVLGLYGGKDKGIPLDTVEKMKSELKAAKRPSELVVYPEAEHGFHADYRPSYNPDAATKGWDRMLSWFKKHGV